ELARGGHDGGHVIGVTGKHHPDRLDRVHARVAGEQAPAVGVEPHLATDGAAQGRRDVRSLAGLAPLIRPGRAGTGRLTADVAAPPLVVPPAVVSPFGPCCPAVVAPLRTVLLPCCRNSLDV